ncbi:MAG: choice-of-anchor X domain-containing protein, partial [Armatimonadota bacterium]
MRGLVRRALPALILPPLLIALAFLSPGSLARSPRGSYARFLPVGSPRMLRIPGPAGRRTPLTREMLPHLFDNWPRAKSRQGSAPDTPLTPTATDTEEIMPNWAPEPTLETIAFASNGVDADGDGQIDPGPPPPGADFKIWLMRADGSQQRPVTDLPELSGADELDPAFDPGSRLIAFASNATGQFEIYQIDVATKVVTQITSSPPGSGDKRHPTWSADRSLIAFQWKKPGQSWDIYTVPSSGAGSPTLLIGDPSNDTSPAYHPTVATQLAFVSDRVGGVDKIFLHDAGFATPLQLTDGGGNPAVRDRDPAWRIAGTMLAFSSDRRTSPADPFDDFNIWTVGSMGEVGGAIPTLRTNRDETDDTDDVDPAWSPFDIGTPPPDQPPGTPPIVQVVHASNRPVGAGDVLADFNIWSFIENDVTPVRLLALPWIGDPDFNETNRLFMPGEDITIHAQLDDLDSGVGRVFAQIKDPDGPVEDFANVDHQDYFIYGTLFNGTSLPGTAWAHFDFDFFAGASQVELFDDGDVAAHGDAVAGDGIFSGIFTTSLTPSDFFIDLLTTDQAGNFMEYDQIYGFSTQIFNPQNNILLVDDYGSGQMFPYTTFTQHFQPVTDAISYYLFNPSGVDAGTLFPEYPNI